MKHNKFTLIPTLLLSVIVSLAISACQKMDRPPLVIIPDPPPPPYSPLKAFWSFDGNAKDSADIINGTEKNVSYAAGINGQALKGSANGYVLFDTPGDSLYNLNSFTISFWMNAGPAAKATGIFAISNTTQFWGNLEMFMESYSADATTAYLKIHTLNKNAADKENWFEYKIPDVLGKWSHIAVTYNGANSALDLYANGELVKTDTLKGGAYGPIAFDDGGKMVIGASQFMTEPSLTTNTGKQDWATNFSGMLDQFRIYSIPLSDQQVKQLYNSKM